MHNKIKDLRKIQKLSQAQLAILTGATRQTILAIENNKYDPSLQLAFKIAHVLGTNVDDLFIYTELEDLPHDF
ncbi:helix-turn-helix transcriptional regulator [Periweissella beninensis]|uniref:helix-turn-helix transcriptional regulator n=1 Tax=Periweissella beninensis TaxID=504936 RepID=UPI00288AF88D|nr:helix-turn-helix transcriptional regulator [Periweissella beninensis]MCT4396475.1 transcriptional regulator [Periweissella beninensis]